jgi:hypothetical protein
MVTDSTYGTVVSTCNCLLPSNVARDPGGVGNVSIASVDGIVATRLIQPFTPLAHTSSAIAFNGLAVSPIATRYENVSCVVPLPDMYSAYRVVTPVARCIRGATAPGVSSATITRLSKCTVMSIASFTLYGDSGLLLDSLDDVSRSITGGTVLMTMFEFLLSAHPLYGTHVFGGGSSTAIAYMIVCVCARSA